MAVGGYYMCAIAAGGGIKCWGNNGNGQLGIGSYENRKRPADVRMKGAANLNDTSASELLVAGKEEGEISILRLAMDG